MSFDLRAIREATSAHINGSAAPPGAGHNGSVEYPVFERVASMLNDQVLRGGIAEPEMVVHAQQTLKSG